MSLECPVLKCGCLSPSGEHLRRSMTQHCLPLVSVRAASGSELKKPWPAVIPLTNRKSRGRCAGHAATEHGPQGPKLSGYSYYTSADGSPLPVWQPQTQVLGRDKAKQKKKKLSSWKAFTFYPVGDALFSKSPINCHRTSPVWEDLMFHFPTSSREGRGRDSSEHGCWINWFIVSAVCFSCTSSTIHLWLCTEVTLSVCFHMATEIVSLLTSA